IASKFDWQKRFHARVIILIINEHLNKVHAIMNSSFYKFLSDDSLFEELFGDINTFKKSYKELNKHHSNLTDLRNDIIGHRNLDVDIYLTKIQKLNTDEV